MKETERGREIMRRAVEDFGNKKKSEGRIEGIKEGKIEGIKEGIIEGIREGKIETAKNMMAEGMGISFISKILKVPESCLNEWLA